MNFSKFLFVIALFLFGPLPLLAEPNVYVQFQTMNHLKETLHFEVCVTNPNLASYALNDIYAIDLDHTGPLALVIGSEHHTPIYKNLSLLAGLNATAIHFTDRSYSSNPNDILNQDVSGLNAYSLTDIVIAKAYSTLQIPINSSLTLLAGINFPLIGSYRDSYSSQVGYQAGLSYLLSHSLLFELVYEAVSFELDASSTNTHYANSSASISGIRFGIKAL